ncbi:MAG: glycosyltransferase family 4 protein [Candidatus Methanoperedens sp.]
MNRRIKVLFVRTSKSSFIQKDLELLRRHFYVKEVDFLLNRKNLKGTLVTTFKMISGVLWADITFSWFAGYHAYWAVRLSKLFKKKSIVIVGGYEVAMVPEIGYGAMLHEKDARIVRYILKNGDKVLTVDDGLKLDAIKNVGVTGENIETVPTGYDYEILKPDGEKENIVLTVSVGDSWERAKLKGLDTFVYAAKYLQDVKFVLVGVQGELLYDLKNIAPSNIIFVAQMPQSGIFPYHQKAKVYCQLSMREGLPNALCEAMLCECVPVGTDVQGIRTAIGDTGFYVPYGDPEATANAIKEALMSDKGKEARERIKKIFPVERREKDLIEIIQNISF